MLKFNKLNYRFISAPIDDDRIHGNIITNVIGGGPLTWSGFSLNGVSAGAVAIVDAGGNQITSFGSTSTIISPIGQKTMAASVSIAIASDQTALPITGTISATNPSVSTTGAAVPASATYIGFNSGGNLTAVSIGQQTAANSIPVILPSATITTLTPPTNTGYALDSSLTTINTNLQSNITLHAGTNNIGIVDIADTGGNKFTSNSTTYTAKFALDSNLLGTLGTAFSTAGKVDVKAADGDVFIRQATGTNLHMVVDSGTITTLTTLTSITNNVNVVGTKTNNNAAPGATNVGALVAIANAAAPSWTEGNEVLVSTDLKGNTRVLPTKTDTFGTATAMTITLASLATSSAGVGRQSTLVSSNTAGSALITVKFTVGTTPTANTLIYVYLLRGDGTIQDDNAGASDAAITVINAPLLGTILCSAVTSNATYYGVFDTKFLGSLSTSFGVAIVNSTAVTANATAGNFAVQYTLIT